MTQQPRASIVTIFFNEAAFLREAIDSVLAQTYANWELLLVDDGSTDAGSLIARGFAQEHQGRIRYLEHPGHVNRGTGPSRNFGVRQATGRYIAFLDADDVWFPYTLEEQVCILEQYPEAAMVYGPLQWWFSWSGQRGSGNQDYVEKLGVPADTLVQPPTLLPLFLEDKAAVPSGILVRREAMEAIGEIDEAFTSEYEDQVLCAKICLKAPVFVSGRCWYRYRRHPESCVAVGTRTGETHQRRMAFLGWLEQYLSEQGIRDARVWDALRREIVKLRNPVLPRTPSSLRRRLGRPARAVGRRLREPVRRFVLALRGGAARIPAPGAVRFGSLRRLTPLSRQFGYDRGRPIDRYYIERFLEAHQKDIRGSVLEILDDTYTRRFGRDRVTRRDVLDVDASNPVATIIADLARRDGIPEAAFDCAILTQTFQYVYDVRAALATIHYALKPGGVMLASVPGISHISRYDMDHTGEYWRFTTGSAQRLCQDVFRGGEIEVRSHGNVLVASAFLFGLSQHELEREELEYIDPDYQIIITIRATKSTDSEPS